MITMFVLWALYHSLVNVGQRWYSFGKSQKCSCDKGHILHFFDEALSRIHHNCYTSPVYRLGVAVIRDRFPGYLAGPFVQYEPAP